MKPTMQVSPAHRLPFHEYTPARFLVVVGQPRTTSSVADDVLGGWLDGAPGECVLEGLLDSEGPVEPLGPGGSAEGDDPEQAARPTTSTTTMDAEPPMAPSVRG
jgi:hypothetical protein